MSDCCSIDAEQAKQRQVLWLVLVLNALMFGAEFVAGWLADSNGLLADSLDMLADALVYAVSLYAVGRLARTKAKAALVSGTLQLALGIFVLVDVTKSILFGSNPDSQLMMSMALLALAVNLSCFALLYRFRKGDLNMQASWICSRNDMLANCGVILSGYLVSQTQAAWPDWLIGGMIALIVIRSASRIVRSALTQLQPAPATSCCQAKTCKTDNPHKKML